MDIVRGGGMKNRQAPPRFGHRCATVGPRSFVWEGLASSPRRGTLAGRAGIVTRRRKARQGSAGRARRGEALDVGKPAVLEGSRRSFDEIAAERRMAAA